MKTKVFLTTLALLISVLIISGSGCAANRIRVSRIVKLKTYYLDSSLPGNPEPYALIYYKIDPAIWPSGEPWVWDETRKALELWPLYYWTSGVATKSKDHLIVAALVPEFYLLYFEYVEIKFIHRGKAHIQRIESHE